MTELEGLTYDRLRTLRTCCRQVLQSLVESRNVGKDLRAGIDRLMREHATFDKLDAINADSSVWRG